MGWILRHMYAKYGRVHKALELFDKMHDANIVFLCTIIIGYAQNWFLEKGLDTYS